MRPRRLYMLGIKGLPMGSRRGCISQVRLRIAYQLVQDYMESPWQKQPDISEFLHLPFPRQLQGERKSKSSQSLTSPKFPVSGLVNAVSAKNGFISNRSRLAAVLHSVSGQAPIKAGEAVSRSHCEIQSKTRLLCSPPSYLMLSILFRLSLNKQAYSDALL